jgi:rubredoxin
MEVCPECGWPLVGKRALAYHREIKHNIPRYKSELFAIFDHQISCPECDSENIDFEHDEFVDDGGSHAGPAIHNWCSNCDYEWMEIPDFD